MIITLGVIRVISIPLVIALLIKLAVVACVYVVQQQAYLNFPLLTRPVTSLALRNTRGERK